jgi:NADPH-ferrihemoprotein reductase
VQHKLQEHSEEVEVLLSEGGYFYVCGDAAHMARDVHMQLVKIVAEKRNISVLEAAQVITSMRSSNRYQVREMIESTALSIKIQELT